MEINEHSDFTKMWLSITSQIINNFNGRHRPLILDPSLVLTKWGPLITERLARGPWGHRPYFAPALCEFIQDQEKKPSKSTLLEFERELGIKVSELTNALEYWKRALKREKNLFYNIEEKVSTTDIETEKTEMERRLYKKCFTDISNSNDVDATESLVNRIFLQQVAMVFALSTDGAMILARGQSEPWIWRWLKGKKKGLITCQELTDIETKALVEEKKAWLRAKGLNELATIGIGFWFVKFIFPEPNLLKAGLEFVVHTVLEAGVAFCVDP